MQVLRRKVDVQAKCPNGARFDSPVAGRLHQVVHEATEQFQQAALLPDDVRFDFDPWREALVHEAASTDAECSDTVTPEATIATASATPSLGPKGRVLKTTRRTVVSLNHGRFQAHETVRQHTTDEGQRITRHSTELGGARVPRRPLWLRSDLVRRDRDFPSRPVVGRRPEVLLAFHFWINDYRSDGRRRGFPFDPYTLYLHRRLCRAQLRSADLLDKLIQISATHSGPDDARAAKPADTNAVPTKFRNNRDEPRWRQ